MSKQARRGRQRALPLWCLAMMALAFAGLSLLVFRGEIPSAALPALLVFAVYSIALGIIDIRRQLLPDRIVLPSYGVFAVLLSFASWAAGDWTALLRALAGGIVLFAFFLLVALISPAGMGLGDVKLAGVIGLILGWFGWTNLLVGVFAGLLVGAAVGMILVAAHRAGRATPFPFGPWLLAGAWIGILWGGALGQWYLAFSEAL